MLRRRLPLAAHPDDLIVLQVASALPTLSGSSYSSCRSSSSSSDSWAALSPGLGQRLGIAPWPARTLFMLLLLLIPGSQILIYPILWILIRSESTVTAQAQQTALAPA